MDRRQLEMKLENPLVRRPAGHGRRRLTRARWWFQQMHQAVEQASDWQPASPPDLRPR